MKKGFTLLEVILSVAVLAMLVTSIFPVIAWLTERQGRLKFESQAGVLLSQAVEVGYSVLLTAADWSVFSNGSTFHPAVVSDGNEGYIWGLDLGAYDAEPGFGRVLQIEQVCRNSSSGERDVNCAYGSVVDPSSRVMHVTVTWHERGNLRNADTELLVTKI